MRDALRRYRKKHPEVMREIRRRWRKRHPELVRERRRRYYARHRKKLIARSMVAKALKAGLLVKRPCAVCGKRSVGAHHEDYSKPLEVTWLCVPHALDAERRGVVH
jgi:hypothetical protein